MNEALHGLIFVSWQTGRLHPIMEESMRQARTWLARLLVVALAAFGLAATATAAQADEVGPYNPPPPVYVNYCNPMAVGTYNAHPLTPELITRSGPTATGPVASTVHGDPRIQTWGNTSCAAAKVQFRLQTKACGVWGCHWQTRAQSDWVELPAWGVLSHPLDMDCRAGINSYRTVIGISHVEADTEESPFGTIVPYLTTKTDDVEGDVVTFTC